MIGARSIVLGLWVLAGATGLLGVGCERQKPVPPPAPPAAALPAKPVTPPVVSAGPAFVAGPSAARQDYAGATAVRVSVVRNGTPELIVDAFPKPKSAPKQKQKAK